MAPTLILLRISLVSLCCLFLGCRKPDVAPPPGTDPSIAFVHDGRPVRSLKLSELLARIPKEEWRGYDSYYNREKGWATLPLSRVVEAGFEGDVTKLDELDFIFRANDGYAVPFAGKKLVEPGAYLAFRDLDNVAWEPIGPQRANPGAFYVVWRGKDQQSLEAYPRPWQLASIEVAAFESTYPHTFPRGGDAHAAHGFRLFREGCSSCHAMNREGGHVGPELNVPQSIVEYRPEAQIRAYIVNPLTFRYGNMPAHSNLTKEDLDDLVAYFHAMKDQKYDPK